MTSFYPIIQLIGRVLMSLIFFYAAYSKVNHWDGTLAEIAGKGIPQGPILLFLICLVEFLGALCLVIGYKTRLASYFLFGAMIVTIYLFNDFWNLSGSQKDLQFALFLKNLAIMGGLCLVAVAGAGSLSIDKK